MSRDLFLQHVNVTGQENHRQHRRRAQQRDRRALAQRIGWIAWRSFRHCRRPATLAPMIFSSPASGRGAATWVAAGRPGPLNAKLGQQCFNLGGGDSVIACLITFNPSCADSIDSRRSGKRIQPAGLYGAPLSRPKDRDQKSGNAEEADRVARGRARRRARPSEAASLAVDNTRPCAGQRRRGSGKRGGSLSIVDLVFDVRPIARLPHELLKLLLALPFVAALDAPKLATALLRDVLLAAPEDLDQVPTEVRPHRRRTSFNASLSITRSKSGTVSPGEIQPRSPPLTLVASSELTRAKIRELRPADDSLA
jgi:hypothetical protein